MSRRCDFCVAFLLTTIVACVVATMYIAAWIESYAP